MKRTFAVITGIILLALAVLVTVFLLKGKNSPVEAEYKNAGGNVNYPTELAEEKNLDEQRAIRDLEKASEYLYSCSEGEVFVANMNYSSDTAYIVFNPFIEGAVFTDRSCNMMITDGEVEHASCDDWDEFFECPEIAFDEVKEFDEVEESVLSLIKKNKSRMEFGAGKAVWRLEFNEENRLFYNVKIGNYSYIKVDAISGEVIDDYYFNGVYN